jgi:PhnB protein
MATEPIPKGMETAIPHLVVSNGQNAIEFYKEAFGAEEISRSPAPDGKRLMHAVLKLGPSYIFLCDDFPEMLGGKKRDEISLGGSPVTIHQYVKDCDAIITCAEKAGAKVTMKPQDMFWGDRYGTIKDPFGFSWSFATHTKDVTHEETMAAAREAFSTST